MSRRPKILLIVPWLEVGGADAIGFQLIESLGAEFEFGIVTTLSSAHVLESQIAPSVGFIKHAARQNELSVHSFLETVVQEHEIDAVLVNWSAAGYEALPRIRSNGHIWCADIVHNTVDEGWFRHAVLFDPYLDRHFGVGPGQVEELVKRASIAPEKVSLVPNGVDVAKRFNPAMYSADLPRFRREFDIDENATVIAFVARLSPEKDCMLFARAFGEVVRRNPSERFVALVAGDGPERPQFKSELSASGVLEQFRFLGMTDRVPAILAVSDYLFLTSRIEGSPFALLEAMAMGVVPITTDVGTVRDVITRGRNGQIVHSAAAAAFAQAFGDLSPSRESLAAAARKTIVDRFSRERMIDSYRTVLRLELL